MSPSKTIMAVDPGGTTGVTIMRYLVAFPQDSETHTWEQQELKGAQHHSHLYTLLSLTNPDVLLWEMFIDSPQEGVVETVSLEYIGVMELWLQERKHRKPPIQHVTYPSAKVKQFWTKDKLQRIMMWHRGSTHINDSTRQVLIYLQEHGLMSYVRMLREAPTA